ncbi:TKL protein kinase [Phytophthora cinnamomi]|uniref:TKL protein kinase n=1 Tax=Phytophthora cinnamomi TaxID=4785 RepID=UPI00355A81BA|nr:TKL protein kinase [Phytophthora cinnamomi]
MTNFGISRERLDCTMTAGVGTTRWMVPEVMLGEINDGKAGVFSFGVLLSELDVHSLQYAFVKVEGVAIGHSYLDWHVAKHDVYGEQFCTSWEAADEDHEDMDDFNLDELHDALDDAALIDE